MNPTNILLIPLLPLLSFILLGLFGKSFFKTKAGLVGCSLMLVSFLIAVVTASSYFFNTGLQNGQYQQLKPFLIPWLKFANGLVIEMGLLIDPLSMIMIFVVTFISLMVHIFSLSYMKGEDRFHVYYAFLGLFSFSMLGLVLSSNIFQIYIFWELVGVSSFLLIGFFYQKSSALAAAKKAFIVTRFADLGFLVGILLLSAQAGTLDFLELISKFTTPGETLTSALATTFMGFSVLSWGLALGFMGAMMGIGLLAAGLWYEQALRWLGRLASRLARLLNGLPLFGGRLLRRLPEQIDRVTAENWVPNWLAVRVFALTVVLYVLLSARLFYISQALHLSLPWSLMAMGACVTQLTLIFSFTPGSIGFLEGGWTAVLSLAGLPPGQIILFLIGRRAFTVAFVLIDTLLAFGWIRESPARLFRAVLGASRGQGQEPNSGVAP
jgi:hypothetical protein